MRALCGILLALVLGLAPQNVARIPGIGGESGTPAGTAPSWVVDKECGGAGFLSCVFSGVSITAGQAFYVACFAPAGDTIAISDSKSDTFVVANSYVTYTGVASAEAWYVQSAVGGSTTVTCAPSPTPANWTGGQLVVMSGVTSPALDQVGTTNIASSAGGTFNLASTSSATTQINELAVASLGNSGDSVAFPSATAGSGCTINTNGPNTTFQEHCTLSSAGVYTPAMTTTGATQAGISFVATFK